MQILHTHKEHRLIFRDSGEMMRVLTPGAVLEQKTGALSDRIRQVQEDAEKTELVIDENTCTETSQKQDIIQSIKLLKSADERKRKKGVGEIITYIKNATDPAQEIADLKKHCTTKIQEDALDEIYQVILQGNGAGHTYQYWIERAKTEAGTKKTAMLIQASSTLESVIEKEGLKQVLNTMDQLDILRIYSDICDIAVRLWWKKNREKDIAREILEIIASRFPQDTSHAERFQHMFIQRCCERDSTAVYYFPIEWDDAVQDVLNRLVIESPTKKIILACMLGDTSKNEMLKKLCVQYPEARKCTLAVLHHRDVPLEERMALAILIVKNQESSVPESKEDLLQIASLFAFSIEQGINNWGYLKILVESGSELSKKIASQCRQQIKKVANELITKLHDTNQDQGNKLSYLLDLHNCAILTAISGDFDVAQQWYDAAFVQNVVGNIETIKAEHLSILIEKLHTTRLPESSFCAFDRRMLQTITERMKEQNLLDTYENNQIIEYLIHVAGPEDIESIEKFFEDAITQELDPQKQKKLPSLPCKTFQKKEKRMNRSLESHWKGQKVEWGSKIDLVTPEMIEVLSDPRLHSLEWNEILHRIAKEQYKKSSGMLAIDNIRVDNAEIVKTIVEIIEKTVEDSSLDEGGVGDSLFMSAQRVMLREYDADNFLVTDDMLGRVIQVTIDKKLGALGMPHSQRRIQYYLSHDIPYTLAKANHYTTNLMQFILAFLSESTCKRALLEFIPKMEYPDIRQYCERNLVNTEGLEQFEEVMRQKKEFKESYVRALVYMCAANKWPEFNRLLMRVVEEERGKEDGLKALVEEGIRYVSAAHPEDMELKKFIKEHTIPTQ